MNILSDVIIGFVALEHLGFLVLEMFFWRKPIGLKIFHMTQAVADSSAILAANQGLYNGFLAAGLVWGLLLSNQAWAASVKTFFLLCIVVAGVFGGITANRYIFLIQAVPSVLALAILWIARF